jgi:quercetin dioxygenase-like cupin family protein
LYGKRYLYQILRQDECCVNRILQVEKEIFGARAGCRMFAALAALPTDVGLLKFGALFRRVQNQRNPANRITRARQATPGVEGYVFDGADQSQMAFWTCSETASSEEHVHEFDEYMVVVQGCYTLLIRGERIPVKAGEEYFIPRGVPHGGEVVSGTRTIHAFGGHRADRERSL